MSEIIVSLFSSIHINLNYIQSNDKRTLDIYTQKTRLTYLIRSNGLNNLIVAPYLVAYEDDDHVGATLGPDVVNPLVCL